MECRIIAACNDLKTVFSKKTSLVSRRSWVQIPPPLERGV